MTWPVSDEAHAAFLGDNVSLIKVEVLSAGVVQAHSSTGSLILGSDVKVEGGQVRIENRAAIRRSYDLDLADVAGALLPLRAGDLLDPVTGNEVRLYRGVLLEDGTPYFVPLITGTIEASEVVDTAQSLTLGLSGFDRARRMELNVWRSAYTIAAATRIDLALQALVQDRLTGVGPLVFAFEPTTEVTGAAITYGPDSPGNPLEDAHRLAAACGKEFLFDPMGTPTLRTPVDPAVASPVIEYDDRSARNALLDPLGRSADRGTLRNGAVVESDAPWLTFPLVGTAWDDDLTSPTRRALIGEHPEPVKDATVWTQTQANLAAQATFLKVRGVEENITWRSLVHPGLDGGDVITVAAASLGSLDVPARLAVQSLVVPFGVTEAMSGTTRRRRT